MQNSFFKQENKPLNLILLLVFIVSTIISFCKPNLHDYRLYMIQWEILSQGKTLPNYDNAYGVIHYLFTPIYIVYSQLPKLVYVFIYLHVIYVIYKEFNLLISNKVLYFVLGLLILNPIFWTFGVLYGSNDLFVSSVTLLSIIYYKRDKYLMSSLFLFLGIAYKFFPILLLPFLAIDNRKIRYKNFMIISLLICVLYLFGYFMWGETILNPFIFGGSRGAKMLSIFAFINSSYAPLRFVHIYHLDFLSVYCVIISWVITFFLYFKYRLDKIVMIFLCFSNVLLFYKVGHHQFYFTLFFINAYLILIHFNNLRKSKGLILSFILFWIFLFSISILYVFTDGYSGDFNFVREVIGLPFFIIHCIMNFYILKFAFILKKNI